MPSAYPEKYDVFVRELRAARKEKGLTQDDVNDTLGLHRTFVSKVETGERRLDVVELMEICKVLDIDPAEFIHRLAKKIKRF